MAITLFYTGLSYAGTFVSSFETVKRQFGGRHLAFFVGLQAAGSNVGPLILTYIYETVFFNDGQYSHQNIRGYMIFLLCGHVIFGVLCLVSFRFATVVPVADERSQLITKDTKDDVKDYIAPEEDVSEVEWTVKGILTSSNFYLTCIPAGILIGMKDTPVLNTSMILASMGLAQYETVIPYLQPSFSLLFKPIIGALFDKTRPHYIGAWYLVYAALISCVTCVICMYYITDVYILSVAFIVISVASDVGYVQQVIFTMDFGNKYFAINNGISHLFVGVLCLAAGPAFSSTYDYNAGVDGYCYGLHCFADFFMLCSLMCALCVLLLSIYIANKYYQEYISRSSYIKFKLGNRL